MKQVLASPTRRVDVAKARRNLAEVLRDAANGPTILHSRGRDLAVLLGIEQYENLVATRSGGASTGEAFLARIEAVKRRHGGGVESFEPERIDYRTVLSLRRIGV